MRIHIRLLPDFRLQDLFEIYANIVLFSFSAAMFERFRSILHEGTIDKRVQYMIEGLFAVRKANFKVCVQSTC